MYIYSNIRLKIIYIKILKKLLKNYFYIWLTILTTLFFRNQILAHLEGVIDTFYSKVEFELEVLKEKREMLTKMLLELMDTKKQRAEDLQVQCRRHHF